MSTARATARRLEITDVIWAADRATGLRLPVNRSDAAEALAARGQSGAAKLVASLPANNGILDADAVDALLWRVHTELQRLSEEMMMARRVAATVEPWVRHLRSADPNAPVRILDVGCGLGYVTRWLATHDLLGDNVEFVGIDHNTTLISYATALAEAEAIPCRFIAGEAFNLDEGVAVRDRTIVISTGVLHHLEMPELAQFFQQHQAAGVAAFAHWDTEPGPLTTLGAHTFHRARMRERVSRHDGVLSAQRAYPAATILEAASGCTEYVVACRDHPKWRPTVIDVLRPVIGIRRAR